MIPLPVTPGRSTRLDDPETPGKFQHVELEITTACDLDCFGCDRFSDVTNAPNMSVEQVKRFVTESIELEWRWERVRLLGGEPTLHPQLQEIVHELMRYRRWNPKCFLQLLSNGRGRLAQYRTWLIDRGVDPHVESKDPGVTPAWFNNTRIAPVDRGEDTVEPCGIFGVQGCGIGLTTHGYFLDGAGASVARVAGLDVGKMSLREVTWESMLEQAKVLCRLCGHKDSKKVTETGEVTGAYWSEALTAFKLKRPKMSVYGS